MLESLFYRNQTEYGGILIQRDRTQSEFTKKGSNFVKKRLKHRCFSVNISNFLKTVFSAGHLRWLFLKPESYLEASQTSTRDLFYKNVTQ